MKIREDESSRNEVEMGKKVATRSGGRKQRTRPALEVEEVVIQESEEEGERMGRAYQPSESRIIIEKWV